MVRRLEHRNRPRGAQTEALYMHVTPKPCTATEITSLKVHLVAGENFTWGAGGALEPLQIWGLGLRKGTPRATSLFPQNKCLKRAGPWSPLQGGGWKRGSKAPPPPQPQVDFSGAHSIIPFGH